MAKEEECRQCTKCKVGSYGTLKCSFYGRLPEFNDSSCPKFTQSNAPIEVKKKEEITKTEVKESVKPDQVEVKEKKKEEVGMAKRRGISVSLILLLLFVLIIIKYFAGLGHLAEFSVKLTYSLVAYIPIVFLAYIYVFYKIKKICKPYKEQLRPFYNSFIKIKVGSIVDRVFWVQILKVVVSVACMIMLIIYEEHFFYHYGLYKVFIFGFVSPWMVMILLILYLLCFSVRLFRLKHKPFASWILATAILMIMYSVVIPLAIIGGVPDFFRDNYLSLFIVATGIFDICAIVGADILIRNAEKTFPALPDSK